MAILYIHHLDLGSKQLRTILSNYTGQDFQKIDDAGVTELLKKLGLKIYIKEIFKAEPNTTKAINILKFFQEKEIKVCFIPGHALSVDIISLSAINTPLAEWVSNCEKVEYTQKL